MILHPLLSYVIISTSEAVHCQVLRSSSMVPRRCGVQPYSVIAGAATAQGLPNKRQVFFCVRQTEQDEGIKLVS